MTNDASTFGPATYSPYPTYPYSPPITGTFHDQKPRDPSLSGRYSVYIPANFEHCSPAILVLPPDSMTAQGFMTDITGQAWVSLADSLGVAIVVAEAYQGGTWNISNVVVERDDEAYLYGIVDTIRQKFATIAAAFNLDERSLYLVGYEEGGNAAHKLALTWPQLFAGLASIDGGTVPADIIGIFGSRRSYPFIAGQNSDGRETIGLANASIPLPVWIISQSTSGISGTLKDHWIASAQATPALPNAYAQEIYENGATEIWVTTGAIVATVTPEDIFSQFLAKSLRYTDVPGGRLRKRLHLENDGSTGFFFTEMTVDGRLRRWLTYVPSTYDPAVCHPLVVALHGGSNNAQAFIGDSLWHQVAEQHGLIVLFPNAFPSAYSAFNWIPTPVWNQGVPAPSNPADDVTFLRDLVTQTKQDYNIDAGRVYATGHSSGGGMTWRLGLLAPELFAAIAPAGYTVSGTPANQGIPNTSVVPLVSPLPVWVFMGRYDQVGADSFEQGNFNDQAVNYWSGRNGFDPSTLTTAYIGSGRYFSRTWTNGEDSIPLFRYTSVANLPHIYEPFEASLLWEQFFSRITLAADGTRYFDGQAITRA